MEELKSCKICGKLYQPDALSHTCPNCAQKDEAEFNNIREYLYEHPHASIYEVATNLDVTINKIKHYLREGRIEIVEKDNRFLECEICGIPIRSGRYCDECVKNASHDYKSAFTGDLKQKTEHKVSFLTKNDTFKKPSR